MDRETKKIKKKNNLKYIITFSLLVERRVQDIPLATYLLLVFFFWFFFKKKKEERRSCTTIFNINISSYTDHEIYG